MSACEVSAGRDAFTTLLGMLEAAVQGKPTDEQEQRLARIGVVWWKLVDELKDPSAAARLVRAMWDQMSAMRPEAPCDLDGDFRPGTKAA